MPLTIISRVSINRTTPTMCPNDRINNNIVPVTGPSCSVPRNPSNRRRRRRLLLRPCRWSLGWSVVIVWFLCCEKIVVARPRTTSTTAWVRLAPPSLSPSCWRLSCAQSALNRRKMMSTRQGKSSSSWTFRPAAECCSWMESSSAAAASSSSLPTCWCPTHQYHYQQQRYPSSSSSLLYCQVIADTTAAQQQQQPSFLASAPLPQQVPLPLPLLPEQAVFFQRHGPSLSSSSSSSSPPQQQVPWGGQESDHNPALQPTQTPPQQQQQQLPALTTTSWKDRLLQLSNIASILCILDCTVLPLILLILPVVGSMESLHQLGHAVALYFVLPVGSLALGTNYAWKHQRKWITSIGLLGLLTIALANGAMGGAGGHEHVHTLTTQVPAGPVPAGTAAAVAPLWHAVQHGVTHRVVNLLGCALLMLSNYLSHRFGRAGTGTTKSCASPHCNAC